MSTLTLSDVRTSNHGEKRSHWDICRDGLHIANLGKGAGAWARWSVLPVDPTGEYATFSSKAAALTYAANL